MLELSALLMTRGGWAVWNRACYPDRRAFRNASYRLKKAGLTVHRQKGGLSTPQLELTPVAKDALPAYFHPEAEWDRKWNSIWYMLVYDVPEVDRKYRNVLRSFLRKERLGCLQQSVWVTPRDIRPEFDDLVQVAAVDAFAFLFESKTVLGLPSWKVSEQAWNLDRLYEIQKLYCETMQFNLDRLEQGFSEEEAGELLRLACNAYQVAFAEDPLLPDALLPRDYLGKKVRQTHLLLIARLGEWAEVSL